MQSSSFFYRQRRQTLMWPPDGRGMARGWPAIRQPPWYIDIVANQVKAAKHQPHTHTRLIRTSCHRPDETHQKAQLSRRRLFFIRTREERDDEVVSQTGSQVSRLSGCPAVPLQGLPVGQLGGECAILQQTPPLCKGGHGPC